MEFYNNYISQLTKQYNAEIAFLSNDILINEVFFLDFVDQYHKQRGFYRDQFGYLKSLFWEARKSYVDVNKFAFEKTDLITSMNHNKQFHTYIQVINDIQNPQLNGQFMIFKFGFTIYSKITDNMPDIYDNTFMIKINLKHTMIGLLNNYDNSHMLEKHYIQPLPELAPLNSIIHFPNFNLLSIKKKS